MFDRGERLHVPRSISSISEVPDLKQSLETVETETETVRIHSNTSNDEVLDMVLLFLQNNPFKPSKQKDKDFLSHHQLGKPKISGSEFNHTFSEIESLGSYSRKLDFALKAEDFRVSYQKINNIQPRIEVADHANAKSNTTLSSSTTIAAPIGEVIIPIIAAEQSIFLKGEKRMHAELLETLKLREQLKMMSCSTTSSVGLVERRVIENITKRGKLQRANTIWNHVISK